MGILTTIPPYAAVRVVVPVKRHVTRKAMVVLAKAKIQSNPSLRLRRSVTRRITPHLTLPSVRARYCYTSSACLTKIALYNI